MHLPRRRVLTDQDRAAWVSYACHVAPLAGVEMPVLLPMQAAEAASVQVAVQIMGTPPIQHRPAPPVVVGVHPPGVDNATWVRFRSGKLVAARTLDLHGRTAQRAFAALQSFLHAAHADRLRCVEIITGRGAGEGGGVLRRELPMWLNLAPLRPLVLAASHPHAANPGSVRVLLRRHRSASTGSSLARR